MGIKLTSLDVPPLTQIVAAARKYQIVFPWIRVSQLEITTAQRVAELAIQLTTMLVLQLTLIVAVAKEDYFCAKLSPIAQMQEITAASQIAHMNMIQ